MSAAQVSALTGTPPARTQDQTTFDANFAAFVVALYAFQTQVNALSTEVNAESTAALAAQLAAAQSALDALTQANTAINATNTGGTSNNSLAIQTTLPASISLTTQTGKGWSVGQYVNITSTNSTSNWMLGRITAYNSGTGAMTVTVTNAQGSGTYTAWTLCLAGPVQITVQNSVVTKTGASTLYGSDKGVMALCSGTWSLGLDAAATLGAGWYAYVKNNGTGVITLDPNSSETIDGQTTVAVDAGTTCLIVCDGSAFYSVRSMSKGAITVIASTTTYSPPYPCWAEVTVQDGGQGGNYNTGGSASDYMAGGKGGDAGSTLLFLQPSVTYTATVGAGSAASTGTPAAGGSSSFSGSGITTLTSVNASLKVPGGLAPSVGTGIGPARGGGSMLAPTGSTGYGAGGAGGNSSGVGTATAGQNGAVVIKLC